MSEIYIYISVLRSSWEAASSTQLHRSKAFFWVDQQWLMDTVITTVSEMERQEVWRSQKAWAWNQALPLANFVTMGWGGGGVGGEGPFVILLGFSSFLEL